MAYYFVLTGRLGWGNVYCFLNVLAKLKNHLDVLDYACLKAERVLRDIRAMF